MSQTEVQLRISVLGPVRAWLGGRELTLGPPRQRTVFGILAANANRFVAIEEFVEGAWGGKPPRTATGSVYTYMCGLRQALHPAAPQVLLSEPSGYQLRLAPGALDSEHFLTLCTEAGRLRAGGHPAPAAVRFGDALRLWCGEPYAGLPGDRLALERAHLGEQRLTAIEQRARAAVEGEVVDDDLIAELAASAHEHPLHEPLHEMLMLALDRAGRHTEGLVVFDAMRRQLATDLGVEPSAILHDVHRRMLERVTAAGAVTSPGPARDVPRPAAPGPAPVSGSGHPLIGRDREYVELCDLRRRVTAGAGAAVWLEGEAGIGKTRLLTAALAEAPAGYRLAWAAAEESERHVPFGVLSRALGLDPAGHDADPVPIRIRTGTMLEQVRAACTTTPLVLVVDDMQWADDASMALWQRLTTATEHLPLLVVAAARSNINDPDLSRLRRGALSGTTRMMRLRGLSLSESEQLLTTMAGMPPGPHLRARSLRYDGNPLFLRADVSALLRSGAIETIDGTADIAATEDNGLPPSVVAQIRGQVDSFSTGTQQMLRVAALLGSTFSVEDLVAATGRSPFELLVDLEAALATDLLLATGDRLAFRKPLLRQVLRADVPPPLREALHRPAGTGVPVPVRAPHPVTGPAAARRGRTVHGGPPLVRVTAPRHLPAAKRPATRRDVHGTQ